MYSQVASPNSHVSSLHPLWFVSNIIQGWLEALAGLVRGTHNRSRWIQATILFTDIVGFSTAIAHLPRRQQQRVLESLAGDYYHLLHQCVRNCGGRVDKFMGDGMMAIFLNPSDAVSAARQIQESVARFNTHQERHGCPPFLTRTAIASGWVLRKNLGPFWRRDQTYLGNAVNVASHLAKVGRPGQVLISHATFE